MANDGTRKKHHCKIDTFIASLRLLILKTRKYYYYVQKFPIAIVLLHLLILKLYKDYINNITCRLIRFFDVNSISL